jgi:hypothetical protein
MTMPEAIMIVAAILYSTYGILSLLERIAVALEKPKKK